MIMTVVMVPMKEKNVTLNIKLARLKSSLAKTSNVFVTSIDVMVRMIVVIILMKLDAVSFIKNNVKRLMTFVFRKRKYYLCQPNPI